MPLTCYSYAAMPEILQLLTDQPGDLLQQQASVRWMQQQGVASVRVLLLKGSGRADESGGDQQACPLIQGLPVSEGTVGDREPAPVQGTHLQLLSLPAASSAPTGRGGGAQVWGVGWGGAEVPTAATATATAGVLQPTPATVGALQPGGGDDTSDGCGQGRGSSASVPGRGEGEIVVEIRFDPGPGSRPRQAPPCLPGSRVCHPAGPPSHPSLPNHTC